MELWGVRVSFIRGKGAAWRRGTCCMVAVTALALSGCSDQPAPSPTQTVQQTAAQPAATNTPMFASDEEALAAGVAALQRLLDTEMSVLRGDYAAADQYPSLAVDPVLSEVQAEAQRFKNGSQSAVGELKFRDPKLQKVKESTTTDVTFYVCLDPTNVRYRDKHGQPINESSVARTFTLAVTATGPELPLKVSRMDKWSEDPC